MKRFALSVYLAFLLLTVLTGTASAASPNTTLTTNATSVVTTTMPERIGGSVYFETDPPGATIWLETLEVGTSGLTYYSEKTGTFNVRIQKKGYEDYSGTVTVSEGKRTVFEAVLKPVTYDISDKSTSIVTVTAVTTATTLRKSTITLPTPWPTSPQSPLDPAVVIGAAVFGSVFFAIRRL